MCNGLYLKHWFQILSCYNTQTANSKYFPSFLTLKRSSNISFDRFLSEALVIFVPLEIPPFLRWPFSGNRLYAEGHAVIILIEKYKRLWDPARAEHHRKELTSYHAYSRSLHVLKKMWVVFVCGKVGML